MLAAPSALIKFRIAHSDSAAYYLDARAATFAFSSTVGIFPNSTFSLAVFAARGRPTRNLHRREKFAAFPSAAAVRARPLNVL
jgi:hypothetical protein